VTVHLNRKAQSTEERCTCSHGAVGARKSDIVDNDINGKR